MLKVHLRAYDHNSCLRRGLYRESPIYARSSLGTEGCVGSPCDRSQAQTNFQSCRRASATVQMPPISAYPLTTTLAPGILPFVVRNAPLTSYGRPFDG